MLYHPFYKPETGGNDGTPPEGDPPAANNPETWETWLAKQPEEVRSKYDEHTKGLKTALDSEREKAKNLSAQAKRLAELEEAEKKRKEAEMSETQKAQAEKARLEGELKKATEAVKSISLRHAVEIAAAKANFQDPEDAYHLADLSEVTVDEEGKVNGVEKALEALAKKRPYLIKTQKPPDNDAGAGAGKKKTGSDESAIARRFGI